MANKGAGSLRTDQFPYFMSTVLYEPCDSNASEWRDIFMEKCSLTSVDAMNDQYV